MYPVSDDNYTTNGIMYENSEMIRINNPDNFDATLMSNTLVSIFIQNVDYPDTTYLFKDIHTAGFSDVKAVLNNYIENNWQTTLAWSEVSYSLSEDKQNMTAARFCKLYPDVVEMETVKASSRVTKKPTCSEKGETSYISEWRKGRNRGVPELRCLQKAFLRRGREERNQRAGGDSEADAGTADFAELPPRAGPEDHPCARAAEVCFGHKGHALLSVFYLRKRILHTAVFEL